MAIFSKYATFGGEAQVRADYSSSPADFIIECPEPYSSLEVFRVIVFLEDIKPLMLDNYGSSIAGGLTNGITVLVAGDPGTIVDLTDGHPIKTNADWGKVAYDMNMKDWFPSGNQIMVARWTFAKAGEPLILHRPHNDKLVFRVNDDMSTLIQHTFLVQGVERE